MIDSKPHRFIAGRPRVPPAELARRKAQALEMLLSGAKVADVERATKLYGGRVAAIAKAHGIADHRKGTNALKPEVRAAREAHALALLRAGTPRGRAANESGLADAHVKRLADAHGVPRAMRVLGAEQRYAGDINRMSLAELDALEARVAADRASGVLPPISAD